MSLEILSSFLDKTFGFLRDHEFSINREIWKNHCNNQGIKLETLQAAKLELCHKIQSTTNNLDKIKLLEQLFCCDPFDSENIKKLRDSWHEQGEIEQEPFQRWSYEISIHFLQIDIETSSESSQPTPIINTQPSNSEFSPNRYLLQTQKTNKINPIILIIPFTVVSFILGILISSHWQNQPHSASSQSKQGIDSPHKNNLVSLPNFPLATCGDSNPGSGNNWYPVFLENSDENLFLVRRDYCQDAFRKYRKQKGITSIQVASFLTIEKAENFAQILRNRIGNAEVGEPSFH